MPINELVEESLRKPENTPWAKLFTTNSDQYHANIMETNPSKTLKIIPSLSAEKEGQLLIVLRQNLDTFAWDYKDMK